MSPTNKPNNLLRFAAVGAVTGALALAFYVAATSTGSSGVTAQQFINLQEGGSPFAGFRRAHAKGLCVTGEFVSNGNLASYSLAPLFQAGSTPLLGRFSIGGGNPTAADLQSPVRSLALSFELGAHQRWRTAMNTPPVMAVATPDAFYAQLAALAPNPETGERDPSKIQAFFAAHPETQTFRQWSASYQPTSSFAAEQYNSINAFYLVNAAGERQAVRWHAVPTQATGENPYADSANALQEEMAAQLAAGSVRFELVFTLATADDDENNPTVLWPDDRQQIVAGEIVLNAVHDTPAVCDQINFDPLILPRGIEPSDDKILRARSAAYAESYRRRAREVLSGNVYQTEQ